MTRWGIFSGILFTFFLKLGFAGFIAGYLVGCFAYHFFKQMHQGEASSQDQLLYLTITFEVLGHMSKSTGTVTQSDIYFATQVMDSMHLKGPTRQAAQEAFNRGKTADYPLRSRLKRLYQYYRHHKNAIRFFLEVQIKLAFNDGQIQPKEREILYIIAEELHITRKKFELYLRMIESGQHFYQQQQSSTYQQSTSGSGGQYRQPQRATLQDAYNVLGVNASDEINTIKRAYRRLMNEHHPDKLVSKGLPPEMIEMAKERTQEIQAAYDLVRQHRNFK